MVSIHTYLYQRPFLQLHKNESMPSPLTAKVRNLVLINKLPNDQCLSQETHYACEYTYSILEVHSKVLTKS